jgi:hypothetical protein
MFVVEEMPSISKPALHQLSVIVGASLANVCSRRNAFDIKTRPAPVTSYRRGEFS